MNGLKEFNYKSLIIKKKDEFLCGCGCLKFSKI